MKFLQLDIKNQNSERRRLQWEKQLLKTPQGVFPEGGFSVAHGTRPSVAIASNSLTLYYIQLKNDLKYKQMTNEGGGTAGD